MKKTMTIRTLVLVLLTVFCVTMLTACFSDDAPVVVTPEDDGLTTRTTIAVPREQMTIYDVMGINASVIAWSRLKVFTHTDTAENTATFQVADTYGNEAVLTVVYDEAANTVSKAELSYGDVTVSILTEDNMVLYPIIEAMQANDEAQ